jgi:uncharacterized surface protein with fasciclin (FAS1) repeats
MKKFKYIFLKKNLLLLLFGLTFLVSCKDPYEDSVFMAYSELPVAGYLQSRTEDFSLWVEIIDRAGLNSTLNLKTTYTCFVPDNNAVNTYLQKMGLKSVSEITPENAAYLVKYHTLYGVSFDQSQFEDGIISTPTITEDNLSLEFREGGLNAVYINSVARLTEIDIKVTNGIIHVIDQVLIPVTSTIIDELKNPRYSIFYQAIVATGYENMLNTISYDTTDSDGNPLVKRYRFTSFAVPDSIYNLSQITNLDSLKAKLDVVSNDYTSPDNLLNKYVSYHLLSQLKSFADLADFPEGESAMNINTLAEKELISLTDVSGTLTINYNVADSSGVQFINKDISCKNGVIHEINDWMPVFLPPKVTIEWELTDYPDLAAVCAYYQRSDLTGSYKEEEITEGEVTCYTWKSWPEDKTKVVFYRNNRNTDGVWYRTRNYDHLRLELGISGYMDMKTPVIIKGNYKVTLYYISYKSTTSSGIMQCSLDGVKLGNQITLSNTTTDELKSVVLSDSFEFSETTDHQLRIVSLDGKLLTLDYIKFEPVN